MLYTVREYRNFAEVEAVGLMYEEQLLKIQVSASTGVSFVSTTTWLLTTRNGARTLWTIPYLGIPMAVNVSRKMCFSHSGLPISYIFLVTICARPFKHSNGLKMIECYGVNVINGSTFT